MSNVADDTQNRSKSKRSGAQVWITGALDLIVKDGVDALKVEKLAREIGVSKGSFYWFFNGLDDLRFRIMEFWKTQLNAQIIETVRHSQGGLEDKLHLLIDIVHERQSGRYDAEIRAWALRNDMVMQFVRDVDQERIAFLEDLFIEADETKPDSTRKAHLFYRAVIAESYVHEYRDQMRKGVYLKELARYLANI